MSEGLPGFVRELIVQSRAPAFEGARFGTVGAYELIRGRAYCEIEPDHRLNGTIVNLALAPRNAAGRVEYDFDFCILKPIEDARGNGWLLFEAPNRGNKLAISRINAVTADNALARATDAGDGLLMRSGFTIAWGAWQGDVTEGNHRMRAHFPVARRDGAPISACCREEFIPEPNVATSAIVELHPDRFVARLSYPAATLDPRAASLTVREREADPRARPAELQWRYRDARHIEVMRPPGFDSGALYEFIYTACDPVVMGLGLAAIRDFTVFLRHVAHDRHGNPNPLAAGGELPRRALAFGASQSGRVLRDFLYEGFNEDGSGRPVFDAMLPVVTGARRAFLNAAFAQPDRFSRQHEDHLYPGDEFPFGYPTLHDPISGRTDGILRRAVQAGVVPKIAHLEVETELWAARASLLATDIEGRDIAQPENVRIYLAAGFAHTPNPPAPGAARYRHNPLAYSRPLRAVLTALVKWVEHGVTPPPSRYPSRGDGGLADFATVRGQFPAIPQVECPRVYSALHAKDYTVQPPAEGAAYPVFFAATDRDGNALGGIRDPLLVAPIATLTGWMIRAEGSAAGELYGINGAQFPFAVSAAARRAAGDPRPSLEERYGTPATWAHAVARAAQALVDERLLLAEDADRIIAAAARGWVLENFG